MQPIMWRCVSPCSAEYTNPVALARHRAEKHPERVRADAVFAQVMVDTQDLEMAEAAFALALVDGIEFVAETDAVPA